MIDHQFKPCLVCGAPATDLHHEPKRGMGGSKRWAGTLIRLCRKCHDENEQGYLKFEVTITYRKEAP